MNEAKAGCVICRGGGYANLFGVIICRKGAIFVWETLEVPPDRSEYSEHNIDRKLAVREGDRALLATAWRPWIREVFNESPEEAIQFVLGIVNKQKDYLV